MARPILLDLPPRDPRAELRERLEHAPEEHAEALLAAYEVLQGLHDKGVLDLIRGALGSGDKVLEVAVDAAKSPGSIRSIRNLLLMANMLGEINPEQLSAFARAIPSAVQAVAIPAKPPSLWTITKGFLWDRNIRRSLFATSQMLKALGASLGGEGTPR